jgi:S-adenosylmethionine hydrolase
MPVSARSLERGAADISMTIDAMSRVQHTEPFLKVRENRHSPDDSLVEAEIVAFDRFGNANFSARSNAAGLHPLQ